MIKTESKQKESETNQPATTENSKSVELIRAGLNALALLEGAEVRTLTLPEFVEPDSIPIGGVFIGKVLDVVGDFTGNPDMVDCKNIIFQIPGTTKKVMFPMTGELSQAFLRLPGSGSGVNGKVIAMKRQADRVSKRFNNRQFSFEYVKELSGPKVEAAFPKITEK